MNIRLPQSLNIHRIVLLTLVLMVVFVAIVAECGLLPAYGAWMELRSSAQLRTSQYAVLSRNLAVRNTVAEEFRRSASSSIQTGNDEVTLSNFLRDLEAKAHLPGLSIVNIKPLPVRDEKTCKVYSAKLTLAGRLVDVLKFVTGVTSDKEVVGIESFGLHGTQRPHIVECDLTVCKLGLISKGTRGAQTRSQGLAKKESLREDGP